MALTDDDIVRSISTHSPEGIEALYDRYGGLAYSVALRILSDRGAAEDVVQESFLSVWRRGATFQSGRGSLRSWICTIVRNRAIDRLRGDRHRTRLDTPMEGQSIEPAVSDPWAQVALELSGEEVRKALAELPSEQRQTIELAYYGGFSQSEIATKMEVPLGTVKGRVRIALDKLRLALADRLEAPWQAQ
ncbi:MAG TPA: sigma-70 family RNA polymerase sigma factor [Candidatus Dormibacteraeota bacterium]